MSDTYTAEQVAEWLLRRARLHERAVERAKDPIEAAVSKSMAAAVRSLADEAPLGLKTAKLLGRI